LTNIGFRVLPLTRRPDPALVQRFEHVVTPHISDNLHRMHSASAQLKAFHRSKKMVGVAFTVKTRPGDNLMVHKAIDLAQPGDVIVVDAGGDMTNSIIGEIMMRLAIRKGLAGFVIDGAIRDTAVFDSDDFPLPVYAKGVTHRGPYKDGPGEINVPIQIGGMIVHPGDIMVGDEDGIVAVPLDAADDVLRKVIEQQKKEELILQSIADGTVDRTWVDQLLKEKGCDLS